MPLQYFYLLGEDAESAKEIDIDQAITLENLRYLIASYFAIVVPNGRPTPEICLVHF